MTSKDAKSWLSKAMTLATDIRIIVTALLSIVAGGGGTMLAWGDAGVTAAQTTQIADSVAKANDKALLLRLERQERQNMEMWGAMMDKDTALKAAVEARALANQDAARKRAETQKLLNELTGGTP